MQKQTIRTVCLFAALAAAAATAEPVAEVKALLAAQQAAWNRGDLEGYMAGYWRSPELSFFSGRAATRGWEPTLERYRKRYQTGGHAMGHLDFSELSVDPAAADLALARGRWHLTFADGSGAGGLFSLQLRRIEGAFRIVHDHSSGDDEPAPLPKAAPGSLTIVGDIHQPGALALSELKSLQPVSAEWTENGQKHAVRGVPLDRVLASRGFEPGAMAGLAPKDKLPGWKRVAVASAPDGFQAVFTLAELSEAMGPTRALVVFEMDGEPLPMGRGPLRLLVLTDKEPTRSVRQLDRIEVIDAGKAAARH